MPARDQKPTEIVLKKTKWTVEYQDILHRNTYYINLRTDNWYEKEWIRLADGRDKESHVWGASYWRKHFYDIHTGLLMNEIDSYGNKNLLDKRRGWNPEDNEISQEILTGISKKKDIVASKKTTELF